MITIIIIIITTTITTIIEFFFIFMRNFEDVSLLFSFVYAMVLALYPVQPGTHHGS